MNKAILTILQTAPRDAFVTVNIKIPVQSCELAAELTDEESNVFALGVVLSGCKSMSPSISAAAADRCRREILTAADGSGKDLLIALNNLLLAISEFARLSRDVIQIAGPENPLPDR